MRSEMSIQTMMDVLGFTSRPMFIKGYLNPAKANGFIEMTQPDSPKSPTQKYRLTALGKELQRLNGNEN